MQIRSPTNFARFSTRESCVTNAHGTAAGLAVWDRQPGTCHMRVHVFGRYLLRDERDCVTTVTRTFVPGLETRTRTWPVRSSTVYRQVLHATVTEKGAQAR